MREILFRGKRRDNGEWFCGDLLHLEYCVSIRSKNSSHSVIPETVGQYTGLTDKNGNKIFEGDILKGFKYPYLSDGNYNYFAEIVWFDDVSAFGTYTFKNPKSKVRGISDGEADYIEEWNPLAWEIIGNIHDNQLLKGE